MVDTNSKTVALKFSQIVDIAERIRVTKAFVIIAKKINPKFNEELFYQMCGLSADDMPKN